MADTNGSGKKYARLTLKSPKDVRNNIRRILREAKNKGPDYELDNMGKITQMLLAWLKAWELERTTELEQRIDSLEEEVRRNG